MRHNRRLIWLVIPLSLLALTGISPTVESLIDRVEALEEAAESLIERVEQIEQALSLMLQLG